VNAKARRRARQLFALLNSNQTGERETARRKLDELLRRHGKTWNDLPGLLQPDDAGQSSDPRGAASADLYSDFPDLTPADTVRAKLEDYVALEPHEYIAVALWIVHTHVYDQFMVTPRLLLTSPVRNCGKTTVLDIINRLAARPEKSDSITAGAIYHHVSKLRSTMLLDEADNLELSAKAVLRAVLNAGHRKGGSVSRMMNGVPTRFTVFAPVALAGIGSLTLPLMSRSIVIRMRRHDGRRPLRRFDEADTEAAEKFDAVYRHIFHWIARTPIERDPAMPAELRGRQADNWRPLIAIADACSLDWGESARAAAITFAGSDRDEDIGVVLLKHMQTIFDMLGAERLASKVVVDALIEHDDMWAEWRGPRGDERPRKLTQGGLAELLRPFAIRPRKFWTSRKPPKTHRGYFRDDLQEAWRAYCTDPGTPPQRRGIRHIRSI
jgi:hypothetical protein